MVEARIPCRVLRRSYSRKICTVLRMCVSYASKIAPRPGGCHLLKERRIDSGTPPDNSEEPATPEPSRPGNAIADATS